MFPFSPAVTPAVRSHLNAQAAFLNDMSKSLSRSFQNLCQLNIQLSQTLLEESTIAGHQILSTDRPNDLIAVAAQRAQPATEKLRAYQQHISRVAADAQVDFARVAEQHVQETSRTARELADQVARAAAEETDRNVRHQEEALKNFRDPFEISGAFRGNGGSYQGTMQSAGNGQDAGAQFKGNVQGGHAAQAAQEPAARSGKNA
ncbi:TIGR01841 family phasin [Massilia sp. METH4]|uniref:TIGR01841 family phasin n=1 Tax=Massilia sp. METH4 TaxID=3123041 RepID=UPI0030CB25AF